MPTISDQVNPMLIGKTSLVVSVNQTGAISVNGQAVTGGEHDFDRRKRLLSGHTIAMGRKTFESLPKNFAQNHVIIVVSKTLPKNTPDVVVVRHPAEVEFAYEAHGKNLLFILGGGELASALLHTVDVIMLTQTQGNEPGDVQLGFSIDQQAWKATMTMPVSKATDDDLQTLSDQIAFIKSDLLVKGFAASPKETVETWFENRFLPIFKYHLEEKKKPEPFNFSEMFVKMWDVWGKTFKTVPGPRRVSFLSGHDVTINFLLEMMHVPEGGVNSEYLQDLVRYRLYGMTEVSKETVALLNAVETQLEELFGKVAGCKRELSHTYVTLKRNGVDDSVAKLLAEPVVN